MEPFHERLIQEESELSDKTDKVARMLISGRPTYIDEEQWDLLKRQLIYMIKYRDVLKDRIQLLKEKQNT